MKDLQEALYRQLARDMACSMEDVRSRANVFTKAGRNEQMRRSDALRSTGMHLVSLNGKLLVRSEDEGLIQWMSEEYGEFPGAWLSEFSTLKEMDEGLKQFGVAISDFKLYFIPGQPGQRTRAEEHLKDHVLNWYLKDEIHGFKGDARFQEAIVFEDKAPDMIALTASRDGEIRAMTGANADADGMWQMGINVMPGNEGQGIGRAMVTLLKEEILRRGVLPYYGTAMSHIVSQRIAVRAGFVPAFAELTTRRL